MSVLVAIVMGFIRSVVYCYDIIVYLPWMIFSNPKKRVQRSLQMKAKPVVDGDTSSPYRSVDSFDHLTTTMFPGCVTLDDLFTRSAGLYPQNDCLGTREFFSEEDEVQPNGRIFKKMVLGEYRWLTFSEVDEKINCFGHGLISLGHKPKQNVCIFAESRAEWMIVAQSCFRFNFPVVTLYATLGDEGILHGIKESETNVVVTSYDLLEKLKNLLPQLPLIEHVIYVDQGLFKRPAVNGFDERIHAHSFTSVLKSGEDTMKKSTVDVAAYQPDVDDVALIMYTSGSTGLPKGVIISHRNLMAGMSGQAQKIPNLGQVLVRNELCIHGAIMK